MLCEEESGRRRARDKLRVSLLTSKGKAAFNNRKAESVFLSGIVDNKLFKEILGNVDKCITVADECDDVMHHLVLSRAPCGDHMFS